MRGGSVAKHGSSSKVTRKSPNSQSKKSNGGERKKIRYPQNFKTDDWYESMALSMAISAKP